MFRAIVLGAGRLTGRSAAGCTFLVLPSYLQNTLHTGFRGALVATVPANAGFTASILPAGALSDRFGSRAVMVTGAALVVVPALPLLGLLQNTGTSFFVRGPARRTGRGRGSRGEADGFASRVRNLPRRQDSG